MTKEFKIKSLEEKLHLLVRQWYNASPVERVPYEKPIKKYCLEYLEVSGRHYKYCPSDIAVQFLPNVDLDKIRRAGDDFCI